VEHYEIARYGALVAWARACGLKEAAQLLDETLQEEVKTDSLLSELANGDINKEAAGTAKAA
jgi:ferritin-like metal-binding protein YciE